MGGMYIKPCPFCGGTAHVVGVDHRQAYWVRCPECGATGSKVFIQPWHRDRFIAQGQAVKAWNTRKHSLNHIFMIEFVEHWPAGDVPMVALLNDERVTEKEAVSFIEGGCDAYSPYIVCVHKEQYEKLFLNKTGGVEDG